MKNATLVVLSLAAVAGLAGMAGAAPLGVSEIAHNGGLSEIAKSGGSNVSEIAHSGGSFVSQTAQLNSQGITSVQSVPVPGTLLLFGAGFVALTMWHLRSRRGMAA